MAISNYLKEIDEPFTAQARIVPHRKFAFDFHLTHRKILIEFHGEQHYGAAKFFGGTRKFNLTRRRDHFKSRWAKRNGFRLIVVKHTVRDISGFLSAALNLKSTADRRAMQ
jgi:very-short-patch-repair endonuclease